MLLKSSREIFNSSRLSTTILIVGSNLYYINSAKSCQTERFQLIFKPIIQFCNKIIYQLGTKASSFPQKSLFGNPKNT